MEKLMLKSLLVNDDDLECTKVTLTELKLTDLSFKIELLREYDLIVYSGKKGTKILKSKFFNSGKIN